MWMFLDLGIDQTCTRQLTWSSEPYSRLTLEHLLVHSVFVQLEIKETAHERRGSRLV